MQLLAFIFSQQQMRIESGGSGSGPGVPIARGFLLSCPVDRDHHRHTVHAPGGQLPRDSYPGRHIVPFERPFLLFCSGYGGLRQFYDGGYLCPGRCGANSVLSATAFHRRLCGFSGARCLQPKTRSMPWASGSRTTTSASGGTLATYGLMTTAALWYLRAEASVTRLPRSLMWFGVNSHPYHGRRND